ncbi:MAG: polyprenyl synthetase family protein [Oscillochloridaceae bacterium umkhey_bin13]
MMQILLPPPLATDLKQIDQIIHERTHSRAAVISVAGSEFLAPGADRSRAALVLLAAQIGHYERERVIHAAAAAELIYAATRTHHELVDQAERRRGHTRSGEWSHGVTLMVGDYLFALASGEMALSPDPRVIGYYAQAVLRITESTLAPLPSLVPLEATRVQYLERTLGTHAALYAAACRAGAACSGAPLEQIEALGRFGADLGLAMRLADEATEFSGTTPSATSLRAGLVSLPVIFAAAASDASRLTAVLDSTDPAEQQWAISVVRSHGVASTRAEVARLAAQSRLALVGVPPGEAREALVRVADQVLAQAREQAH